MSEANYDRGEAQDEGYATHLTLPDQNQFYFIPRSMTNDSRCLSSSSLLIGFFFPRKRQRQRLQKPQELVDLFIIELLQGLIETLTASSPYLLQELLSPSR